MSAVFFSKYHGLGNDFIILDDPPEEILNSSYLRKKLANRRTGIGCDQILTLQYAKAEIRMRIFNGPDGGEAEACGNGTRCVIKHVAEKFGKAEILLSGPVGAIRGNVFPNKKYRVEQGIAKLMQTQPISISDCDSADRAYAVNIGNPHLVIFLKSKPDNPSEFACKFGPSLECHNFFPNKANVEFCFHRGNGLFEVWMWERGSGRTLACGSGACAVGFAAVQAGFAKTGNEIRIQMEGGNLTVIVEANSGLVTQIGDAVRVFQGSFYLPW